MVAGKALPRCVGELAGPRQMITRGAQPIERRLPDPVRKPQQLGVEGRHQGVERKEHDGEHDRGGDADEGDRDALQGGARAAEQSIKGNADDDGGNYDGRDGENHMTITVEADLRVQHQFPSNYPIYGPSSQGAAVEPQVSVFDERTEEGMEGAIAEYTVYKFGQVPYKVTIECTQRNKAQCKDIAVISRDKELLKLISARPPP